MAVNETWKETLLQLDPLGIVLSMAGFITFILAVEYGGQKKHWSSSTVIGLLVGCVLIWVVFCIWEWWYDERSMLQPRLLRERFVWQPSAFQFFYAAGYFILLYYLPIYFQSVDNRSAISSGVLNLPLVLAMVVGSIISGTTVSKTGHAAPFMAFGAVVCTISAGLMYTFDVDTSMGKWVGEQYLVRKVYVSGRLTGYSKLRLPAALRPCHRHGIPNGHYHCAGKCEGC